MSPRTHEPSEPGAAASAIAYRYVPNEHGYSFPGIPPRDLSRAEFDALTDEQKEAVTESGTYEEA